MFDHLMNTPFHLEEGALAWVKKTFLDLTVEEKIGQIMNVCSFTDDLEEADRLLALSPGGVFRMPTREIEVARATTDYYRDKSKLPLLIAGDFEGGIGSFDYGADYPNALGLAAADDTELTTHVANAMALEARAMGYRWSFTPVMDISLNHRNAIVGTRSFGSDVDTIERHSLATISTWQQLGMATCAKHWPGDGVDDRDQHLVTPINNLSMDQWWETYGRLFRSAIDAGVMSIMSAHIAFPAYIRKHQPQAAVEAYRPATVSKDLNLDLLRGELGFNGLIISDATVMAGLGAWQNREITAPEVIENGCDMFLFNEAPERDFALIKQGLDHGVLTAERLDEAVVRVLGLKAALGLHLEESSADRGLYPQALQDPGHRKLSSEAAERSVTLVKDTQGLLPLNCQNHRRVLVITEGISHVMRPDPVPFTLVEKLKSAGFEVSLLSECEQVRSEEFDLVVYLFGAESMLTRSHIYIDWTKLHGDPISAMVRYWHEVPTLMISFGHPYYLYDAPRVPTYINAYSSTEASQEAVLKALLGEMEITAGNPVDPFCGLDDARY